VLREAVLLIGRMISKLVVKDEDIFVDCCWALNYNVPTQAEEYSQIITP
jgi:hypothetical protein